MIYCQQIKPSRDRKGAVASNRGHWTKQVLCAALVFASIAIGLPASAQDQAVRDGMQIKRVDIQGLATISEGFVRRTIRTRENQPYSERQTREDVRALQRTRKFLTVSAETRVEDNLAVIVFVLQEQPETIRLEIDGNKRFTDQELFAILTFAAGDPLDMYAVNKGREDIEREYKDAGYHYVTVVVDQRVLRAEGAVLYRIVEGPRVRIREIVYDGARAFPESQLASKIASRRYIWIISKGDFDEERADRDALALQTYYRAQGYLDARVGFRLEFDEISRSDMTLVFVIEEGQRYRIQDITFEGAAAFDEDALRAVMELAPGDVPLEDIRQADVKRVADKYGEIGYVEVRINTSYDFLEEPGLVNLRYALTENTRSKFGRLIIRGNNKTQDKVVRRELRFYPSEWYDVVAARKAEQRLMETSLFSAASITPLEDVDGYRDALIEIEEGQTVTFIIGVGVSTDSGALGTLSIENRNFDLFNWPRTFGEFFRGQAFRGAGQRFTLRAEPGTEVSRFRISFTEPYLLGRPVRLSTAVYVFQRGRKSYNEQRVGFTFSLGRRFESGWLDGWAIEGAMRVEAVDIGNVDPLASRQIREIRGKHTITSLKGSIVRDTTDSRILPSEGYRVAFSWEQVGALGGDFSFGKPTLSAAWYKTIRTDIFDRKSVLAVRGDIGMIAGNAPPFERFYAGGFGSIRGFSFRGVSPRAGVFKDPVGGDFVILTGAEYSFPLYAKTLRGVTFLDMGTVEEGFEITDWRASVGFGFRLNINFFGPVPLVFDFGFPIAQQDDDDIRVFNFSLGASF